MARRDDRRHVGTEGLRELDRRRADGAGRAVDEDLVAGLQAEPLQAAMCVLRALAQHGLIEVGARRHRRDRSVFGHAEVLRMRSELIG